jgi:hypothetical protein
METISIILTSTGFLVGSYFWGNMHEDDLSWRKQLANTLRGMITWAVFTFAAAIVGVLLYFLSNIL